MGKLVTGNGFLTPICSLSKSLIVVTIKTFLIEPFRRINQQRVCVQTVATHALHLLLLIWNYTYFGNSRALVVLLKTFWKIRDFEKFKRGMN